MPQISPREAQLIEQLRVALETVARLEKENKLLQEKVDALVKQIFGVKSEKLNPEQLSLLLEGEDGSKKAPAPGASSAALEAELKKAPARPAKPRKEREARVPQNLPAIKEVIIPKEVMAAPEQWRQIGEEVTEQLDYAPGKFFRRLLVRQKYVKREAPHQAPVIAELNTLQERSIAGVGLLAQITVSKYCDHMPLYRLEHMFATRHGIAIPRQSMARWMGLVADWLRPIYEQIRITVFDTGYVQADETPIRYLCPGHGKTKMGYLWTFKDPTGEVCYSWHTSRAAACLESVVPKTFSGVLQCDGYAGYPAFVKGRGQDIRLAGCMAHARRTFFDAKDNTPQQACWILLQMKHLYAIEDRLRKKRAGPRLRQAVRQSQSRPIMNRIYKALTQFKMKQRYLPASAMGKAIHYTLDQWDRLCLYLEDGRLEIDNNLVENTIRCTAIGKKNWLFIGEAGAGDRAAIIYTVLESCRRQGLDPYTYLNEVLRRLPTMTNQQVHEITPAALAKAHSTAQRAAA